MTSPGDLRTSFQERITGEPDLGFHPHDLEQIKDDRYLLRVLKHVEYDLEQATDLLFEVFTWRKSVGANDINESNIRMDYVHEGVIFPHGRDIDGCQLLIIKCKKHIKGQKDFDEFKRVIIYWLDRVEREENGKKITLLYDFKHCGLTNLDMDLINYLSLLFQSYYPYFLNFIIIYQMPWLMFAAIEVIKSLLPARGVHKVKFVCYSGALRDFIDSAQALTGWHGLDNYVFEFVPEKKSDVTSKKVSEQWDKTQHSPGEFLQLTPTETVYFKIERDELTGKLNITNMDESPVSFKVRTTAPHKFRVRPSSGVLASGSSQTIVINVQPGFNMRRTVKDRFLILAVQIPKTALTQRELAEVWQTTAGSQVDEHRLNCYFPQRAMSSDPDVDEDIFMQSIMDILESVEMMQSVALDDLDDGTHSRIGMIFFAILALGYGLVLFFLVRSCAQYCIISFQESFEMGPAIFLYFMMPVFQMILGVHMNSINGFRNLFEVQSIFYE